MKIKKSTEAFEIRCPYKNSPNGQDDAVVWMRCQVWDMIFDSLGNRMSGNIRVTVEYIDEDCDNG